MTTPDRTRPDVDDEEEVIPDEPPMPRQHYSNVGGHNRVTPELLTWLEWDVIRDRVQEQSAYYMAESDDVLILIDMGRQLYALEADLAAERAFRPLVRQLLEAEREMALTVQASPMSTLRELIWDIKQQLRALLDAPKEQK